MQALTDAYLLELSRQLAFLGAFLGGFAATFLVTVLVSHAPRRVAGWVVGAAAVAACAFVVSVVASVMLTTVLHPDVPANVRAHASVGTGRVVNSLSFGLGVFALLAAVGLSGWLRSRRTGLVTGSAAVVALILVAWALAGFA